MRDYNGLEVWRTSHSLVLEIATATAKLARDHRALAAQMKRAAESIPTNIVEGCSRATQRELARFLQISVGSASELEYQLRLARDYEAMGLPEWQRLTDHTIRVRKMLIGLIRKIRDDLNAS